MAKRLKYEVQESGAKYWSNNEWQERPKFKLVKNGELICEMTSSDLMENVVRKRFKEMAKRFNEQPFEIDEKL